MGFEGIFDALPRLSPQGQESIDRLGLRAQNVQLLLKEVELRKKGKEVTEDAIKAAFLSPRWRKGLPEHDPSYEYEAFLYDYFGINRGEGGEEKKAA